MDITPLAAQADTPTGGNDWSTGFMEALVSGLRGAFPNMQMPAEAGVPAQMPAQLPTQMPSQTPELMPPPQTPAPPTPAAPQSPDGLMDFIQNAGNPLGQEQNQFMNAQGQMQSAEGLAGRVPTPGAETGPKQNNYVTPTQGLSLNQQAAYTQALRQ